MSSAAQHSTSTVLDTDGVLTRQQDQQPSDTSQKALSSTAYSKEVSKSDSSGGTLFPVVETRADDGKGIDGDVWMNTLPFPDGLPFSPSCSKPQRCTKKIRTKDKLHTSPDYRDPVGKSSLGARKTILDTMETITVPRNYSSWTLRMLSQHVPFSPGSKSDGEKPWKKSERLHQVGEDGRRTPPRHPTTEAPPESLCTSSDSSDKFKKQQKLVFDAGKTGLFYTLTGRNDRTRPKTAILNLVALQRMNVHALQARLTNEAAESFQTGRLDLEDLQQTLNLYSDAVRNLDFMSEKAKLGYDKDPFLLKSSRALERGILESSGFIPHHVLPKGELPLPYDHEHPLLSNAFGRHHANEATSKKQRLERFAMASFGGLLIIVPMLIMANVPGKVASLVTSCVAIAIFAALVTLGTKLGPHEVLASVAAYAAVLVVFVGLSLEER